MNKERLLFVVSLMAVFAALAISVVAAGLWWRDQADDCQRVVDARSDGRAMFEYLLGEADDADNPRVVEFRTELDARLPRLQCVNNQPVPQEEP